VTRRPGAPQVRWRVLAPRARRAWLPGWIARIGLAGFVLVTIGPAIGLLIMTSRLQGASVKPGEDVFWKAPDFARMAPAAIALLPAVSFDRNPDSERDVGLTWGATFAKGSYRWISAPTARVLLTADTSRSQLFDAMRASVLKDVRVDSLLAPRLCEELRVQAVLSVRVDQWENQAIEADASGKPWTRVHLRAAMVDSLGRLLWTASGTETLEGTEHTPSADRGSAGSTSTSEFATGSGAPPPYRDVLARIFTRWSVAFPQRAADAGASP